MYNFSIENKNTTVVEIKFVAWLLYDITMLGIGGYTFAASFDATVSSAEKLILLIASMIFFIFRIRSLHLDNKRKELMNEEKRLELDERKSAKRSA